jgi:hypothetical protein
VIFFDFLQSDWLQQRAAFYDILTVVQKKTEDNFQTQNTTQTLPYYLKFVFVCQKAFFKHVHAAKRIGK